MKIHIIFEELFQFSIVTYIVLLVFENIKPGSVSSFFNAQILLAVVIGSGIGVILTQSFFDQKPVKKITPVDIQNSILLSIGIGFLIYIKVNWLGQNAYIIAGIITLCILFLSFLFFSEKNE